MGDAKATGGAALAKKDKEKEKPPFPTTEAEWEAEGFQLVNPAVYFYKPQSISGDRITRHTLAGIVLTKANRAYTDTDKARDEREGKKARKNQTFYLVALTRPCVLFDHEKVAVEAVPGAVAWVDHRFNLAPLDTMLPTLDPISGRPARVTEVIIQPDKTVPTGNGNNVWKFKLRARRHEAAKVDVPLLSPSEASSMVRTAESYAASREDSEADEKESYDNGEPPPF